MSMIYLDSCIVIYLIEGNTYFSQQARAALTAHRFKGARFSVSLLSRLESCVMPIRMDNLGLLHQYEKFFATPSLLWLNLSPEVFEIATELRAFHGIKTPDALHLAAAIHHGCDEFWTNDLRLQAAVAGRLSIVNPVKPIKP